MDFFVWFCVWGHVALTLACLGFKLEDLGWRWLSQEKRAVPQPLASREQQGTYHAEVTADRWPGTGSPQAAAHTARRSDRT